MTLQHVLSQGKNHGASLKAAGIPSIINVWLERLTAPSACKMDLEDVVNSLSTSANAKLLHDESNNDGVHKN